MLPGGSLPRPVSWLPRLHAIRKTVAGSVRSHYGRRDLELLFELQPRAAQKLLELLPSTQVGTSRLVEREALAGFLERVHGADDVSEAFDAMRQEKATFPRRSLRTLIQVDEEAASLDAPPHGLILGRGRLEVRFESMEELAQADVLPCEGARRDLETFAKQYEPVPAQRKRFSEGGGLSETAE